VSEQTHLAGSGTTVDLTMMYAMHDALRRDAARLVVDSTDARVTGAIMRNRWAVLTEHLHHHHTGEDTGIWPLLRPHLAADPNALAALDALEAQHAAIDDTVAEVEQAVAAQPGGREARAVLHEHLRRFAELLERHLVDEERDALPLIRRHVTETQWRAFENGQKRGLGLSGAARFFPWLLDDAEPARRAAILATLPAPLRLLVRHRWEPRYRRASGSAATAFSTASRWRTTPPNSPD
jgi:Hemerythrin HHE cation binding domain